MGRGAETLKREAELKRDALHIFRKLESLKTIKEKSPLYEEAVKLYDSLEERGFGGRASLTSARIVFCNAVMDCNGLDDLREAQDANDLFATKLVERIVPIIFSS
eukprot:TRINITY_DN2231_c0_g1_i5.p1 TRINITY_DN2231_c0_g1~~TRINITY_DN2231_c0_g1_i5.p1  ORF type:complete len:105 (-),score=22.34 TRINITY_DN2231_c0_g1_i5:151-465(-)